MTRARVLLLAWLLAALLGGAAAAQAPNAPLTAQAARATAEAAIGRQVGAHRLRDETGAPFDLAALRGRPLVLSLIFTRCASACPVTTERLREAVVEARRALGPDSFAVLTFGFDARGDTPAELQAFARRHDLDLPGWRLASADAETTARLLEELGFSYRAGGGGFEHVTQTTILDAEGRVYRQVYGDAFPLPVFVEPLKDLVFGLGTRSLAPADLWARIRFLCTVYNPSTAAYRFDYAIFFGIAIGGTSLLIALAIVARLWRSNRRRLRDAARAAAEAGIGAAR